MKPRVFEYRRPETLEEGLDLLEQYGYEAKILAGGQSLVPVMNLGLARPAVLVDMNRVRGLNRLEVDGGGLRIGAMVRQYQVEDDPVVADAFPLIPQAVSHIGHRAIRHRGTVGGTLSHADPCAEWGALATALEAEFHVQSSEGVRTVSANQFFLTTLTTSLAPTEMLTSIFIPKLPKGAGSAFCEVARRHGDFALAGVAAAVAMDAGGEISWARLAACGAGQVPVRLTGAERTLLGRRPTAEILTEVEAAATAEVDPEGNIHASAALRRRIVGVCVKRALATAIGNKALARSVVAW